MRLLQPPFIGAPAASGAPLAFDHTMLVEPNLLIPGKKPVGPVKTDDSVYGKVLASWLFQGNVRESELGLNATGSTGDPVIDHRGVDFDGTDGIWVEGSESGLEGQSEFTIAFRWRLNTAPTSEAAMIRKWRSGSQALIIRLFDEKMSFFVKAGGGNQDTVGLSAKFVAGLGFSLGELLTIHCCWKAGTTCLIYINGVEYSTTPTINTSAGQGVDSVAEYLSFGCRYDGGSPDQNADGLLESVIFFDRCFTDSIVAAHARDFYSSVEAV